MASAYPTRKNETMSKTMAAPLEKQEDTCGGADMVESSDMELGEELVRRIASKLEASTLWESRGVSRAFRDVAREHELRLWQMWGEWKDKVLLYPPEMRGYSKEARAIDTSIFKSLLWSRSLSTLRLGKHERESRRFVHWRSAALRLCCPGFTSSCQKGHFRYKQVVLHVPSGFKFSEVLDMPSPSDDAVLAEVCAICFDCGQQKPGLNAESPTGNYCEECYEEEAKPSATWAACLPDFPPP